MRRLFHKWFGPRAQMSRQNTRRSRVRPEIEALEKREVPIRNIVLDFNGATVAELQEALRRIPGWRDPSAAAGMDRRSFVDELTVLNTQYGGYNRYRWLDLDNNGTINRTDGDIVAERIRMRVYDDYLGFNVGVVREDDTNRGLALMNNGQAGDMMVFVWGWHGPGGGGQAPLDWNNSRDDVGEAGGSVGIARMLADGGWTGTAALDAFVDVTANIISHEAGHSFGLSHIDMTRHPTSQGVDMMTPVVGAENLRFRNVSLFIDGGSQQNMRQLLFNVFGAADPAYRYPSGLVWVTGDNVVANVNDRITVDVSGSDLVVRVNATERRFNLGSVTSIRIDSGDGDDEINIERTGGKPISIFAGEDNDTVNISPAARNLGNTHSSIGVDGGRGNDTLRVFDDNYTLSSDTYTVTNSWVRTSGLGSFVTSYGAVENLYVGAGSGSFATINVLSTSANTTVGRAAYVNVGNATDGVQSIRGALRVENPPRRTVLTINDLAAPSGRSAALNTTSLTGMAPAVISWVENDLLSLTVNGGGRGNFFDVFNTPQNALSSLNVTLNSGSGFDTVQVRATRSPMNINGGVGNDVIRVWSLSRAMTINGGDGNDTVNIGGSDGRLYNVADITVNGNAGMNALIVNDPNTDAAGTDYTITGNSVSRPLGGARPILYSGIANLTLNAGRGGNNIRVLNTAAGVTTTVNAGAGSDTITVGSSVNNWLENGGDLTVNGQGGSNTLVVNDSNTSAVGITYDVTATMVSRPFNGNRPITYGGIANLTLNAGRGGNTIRILSTAVGVTTTVNAGAGNDVVNVGDAANSLSQIQGALTVNGQGGTDRLNVNDQAGPALQDIFLTSTTVHRTGTATVTYGTMENLSIRASSGGDTGFNVASTAAGMTVDLIGAGADYLILTATSGTFTISAVNAGQLTGAGLASAARFTGVGNLIGGAGDDRFVFDNGQSISGYVEGNSGVDTLDYSAWTSGVYVDLYSWIAGGTLYALNIRNVIGGSGDDYLHGDWESNLLVGNDGHDILVGDDGNDVLQGGAGYDQLYGGGGADRLEGGAGEDLLIDGTTNYDYDVTAQSDIWNEWVNGGGDYYTRIDNLRYGTGLSAYLLDADNVFTDGDVDELLGGGDLDWFWAADGWDTMDRVDPDEILN